MVRNKRTSIGQPNGEDALRRPSNRDVENKAAAELFQRPIIQPADALHMLVDAASRTEARSEIREQQKAPIDPAIVQIEKEMAQNDPNLPSAIRVWSSLRFVKAGWFTPREGIAYVRYFYDHMASLTPISPPDFSDLSTHGKLLNEEPMLTVTLLTISSRYMELKGPGGDSRSFKIHEQLWQYLQGMITRMFWGQEQFGGGFCGAGKTSEEVEARRRGLRSLGTAER